MLKDAGHTVAVIEEGRIVKGVTFGTTAKISMRPNMIYDKLISNLGKSKGQDFANTNIKAVEKVADIIRKLKIALNFAIFLFTFITSLMKKLMKLRVYLKLQKSCGFQFLTLKIYLYPLKLVQPSNMRTSPNSIPVSISWLFQKI